MPDKQTDGPGGDVPDRFSAGILDSLDIPYLTITCDGRIGRIGGALSKLFGVPPQALMGKPLEELFLLDDAISMGEAVRIASKSGGGPGPLLRGRMVTAKRPQGGTFPADVTIGIQAEGDGNHFVCTVTDLSPVFEARKALNLNQERFALALAGTNEGIWDWDVEGHRLFVSERVRELFGQEGLLDEIEDWYKRIHPGDLPRYKAALTAHFKGETPFLNIDYRLSGEDVRWVRHRGLGLRNDKGRVYRMAGSVGDITETKLHEVKIREALAQAEAANKAKSDFLAAMSHELRTPLNAIIGFSEMIHGQLLGPVGTPKYGEYAGDIMASARHLLDIINDILEMARMEAGHTDFMPEPVDMSTVIDSSLRLLHQRISHSGLTTLNKYPPSLPKILGDERRLKQVIINLVGNAIKFTPKGGSIVIEAKPVLDGRLMVRVVDSGIGIAERDIPRALTPFTQVDSVVARRYQGSGLGLPLAKAFVELHGGNLELSSVLGRGTTVTLHFPLHTS